MIYLNKAIELDPKNDYTYSELAKVYFNNKLYDKSSEALLKAIQIKPDNSYYYKQLGEVYYRKRDFNKAIDVLTDSINLKIDKSAYCTRGSVYNKMELYDKAINDFNEAIKLDKYYVSAFIGRCISYYCLNEFDKAKKDCEKIIKLDPKKHYVYFLNFIISNKISKESGQDSLKLLKRNQKIYIKYERPYLIYKYLTGAIDENKLLSYKDINDEILCEDYAYIGFNYLFKNNKDKAKEYFKKCIETDIFYFIEYRLSKKELTNLQ